jgi:hypothetical protein
MNLQEFNSNSKKKLTKLNAMLREQFGVSLIGKKLHSQTGLAKIKENAAKSVIYLRNTNKKFHLDPDYAKFLGLRDAAEIMIAEGMYVNSPGHKAMCEMIKETIHRLVDSGYTVDEARTQCMKEYRLNPNFAFDEEYVGELVEQELSSYATDSFEPELEYGEEIITEPGLDYSPLEEDDLVSEDDFASDDYFYCVVVSHDGDNNWIGEIYKDEDSGKWREGTVEGNPAANWGGGSYMGYLEPADVMSWINKDYSRNYDVYGPYSDKDKAIEIYQRERIGEYDFEEGIASVMEGVSIEEAEVVIATRALASKVQDQIEELGRMINEEVIKIAEQVQSEMGRSTALSYRNNVTDLLNTYMEAAKIAKEGLDQAVAILSGEEVEPATDDIGMDASDPEDLDTDDIGMEPTGPEGRARVQ